jgi:non-heme chloroperoxidase
MFLYVIVGAGVLALTALMAAFVLVASQSPRIGKPGDVFGFESLRNKGVPEQFPELKRYKARDGSELAYRIYPSPSERLLIFLHGSSYHGGGYQALATAVSQSGAATVVLPNLRGHFQSGRRRGDVDYVGQLEDDIADLIQFLRGEGLRGPLTLGGHSSGGGLAIRYAGGAYGGAVAHYLLLSPVIPTSSSVKGGTAGGWANLNMRRLFGLVALNAFGIHGFNALPIVEFNKPEKYWDGTETLSYSYRLNASYHPRYDYRKDVRALGDKALVMVGAQDEAVDAAGLQSLIASNAAASRLKILPGINHFAIFTEPKALEEIVAWLQSTEPR